MVHGWDDRHVCILYNITTSILLYLDNDLAHFAHLIMAATLCGGSRTPEREAARAGDDGRN